MCVCERESQRGALHLQVDMCRLYLRPRGPAVPLWDINQYVYLCVRVCVCVYTLYKSDIFIGQPFFHFHTNMLIQSVGIDIFLIGK